MRNSIEIIVAALTIAVIGMTMSRADESAKSAIACEVAGYDVIIVNQGTGPIPAGLKVEWSVPFARLRGTHTLNRILEPERPVFLTGALESSYLDPETPCLASFG